MEMNKIKEHLINETMDDLGFDLILKDKCCPDDYYFVHKDMDLIVFYSKVDGTFYTYPKANKGDVHN